MAIPPSPPPLGAAGATSSKGSADSAARAGHDFLRRIKANNAPITMPLALIVAHPDDETIGCGALLRRFPRALVIHVTDGAPHNMADAERLGFPSREAYAAARRAELASALTIAGVSVKRRLSLGIPDQGAARVLDALVHRLEGLVRHMPVVLTHAFEGGHPDHDAVAFAVHEACARLGLAGVAPDIIEMPFYRAGGTGWALQSFAPTERTHAVTLDLSEEEQEIKRRMIAAHASQRELLAQFQVAHEYFRIAPVYDFTRLPNAGALLYERYAWGMTGARWLGLVNEARTRLGPWASTGSRKA